MIRCQSSNGTSCVWANRPMPAQFTTICGRPRSVRRTVHRGARGHRVGDVGRVRARLAALLGDLGRGLLGRVTGDVEAPDRRPLGREPHRGRVPEPGTGAGDHRHATFETTHEHEPPRRRRTRRI